MRWSDPSPNPRPLSARNARARNYTSDAQHPPPLSASSPHGQLFGGEDLAVDEQPLPPSSPTHPTTRTLARPAGRDESTRNLHPLGDTTALLALDVDDVRVAATPTPDAVLLARVDLVPVLVLLAPVLPVLAVQRRRAEVDVRRLRVAARAVVRRELVLPALRVVRRAVLDRRVSIADVAEVVDLLRREERAGRERVDGRIAPL